MWRLEDVIGFTKIYDLGFKMDKGNGRFSVAAPRFSSRASEVFCANFFEYLSGKKTLGQTLRKVEHLSYRPRILRQPFFFQENYKRGKSIDYIYIYTGCHRRNGPNFGRVFRIVNYTDITQNTYVQSWTVSEIMASEVWNFDSCYTLTGYQIHIDTGRNMWFL